VTVGTAVRADGLTKEYGGTRAVDGLSFAVDRGETFGLIGPNGAGKTTTIRMLLGLIQPSEGRVTVLGGPTGPDLYDRIGYLPEERGLYRDVPVVDGLTYLATLKGLDRGVARRRAMEGLARLDLGHVARKPLRALSRGMAQKAQFLATILHEPELLVIDEPFSGLDPVNSRSLRDMLLELQQRGTTVIMSAHQMLRVEELCGRLLVLVRGRAVLYGSLAEIRALFGADSVFVEVEGDVAGLRGVARATRRGATIELELASGVSPHDLLNELAARPELGLRRYEVHTPSLEDIFLAVASKPAAGPGGGAS
jgi:ABC-2 type transport system ATP-binding protein